MIERVTGGSYEKYLQEQVLKPMGASSMRLGHTRLDQRAGNEVRYYQPGKGRSVFQGDLMQTVPLPYGAWNLEAMDAHGGWLASAEDLVRLAMSFDDPTKCPVLSAESIKLMFERPEVTKSDEKDPSFYYSLGWMNRVHDENKINRWHTGSLDGTATILIRRHDGWNMAALINTRSSPTPNTSAAPSIEPCTKRSIRCQTKNEGPKIFCPLIFCLLLDERWQRQIIEIEDHLLG